MVSRVLLVGSGVTTAITAKLLLTELDRINIAVWEKLSEPGGRFCTVVGGKHCEFYTNLGAQYITTTNEKLKNDEIYSRLLSNNIIIPMKHKIKGIKQSQSSVRNYVAVPGMASVVTHFLNEVNVFYKHELISLHWSSNKWRALTESGKEELFDVVVLTMPVPEILKLSGDIETLFMEKVHIYKQLKSVKYSSRYALGLFFEEGIPTEFDSEYVDNDSIIRFIAYDSWKGNDNKFNSATVHTTVQFGEKHCKTDLDVVKEIVVKHVFDEVFPQWPKPFFTTFNFWKYSQVVSPYDSKPGAIVIFDKPLLIAGGDGFIGSTFDQCVFSAKTICSTVTKYIKC